MFTEEVTLRYSEIAMFGTAIVNNVLLVKLGSLLYRADFCVGTNSIAANKEISKSPSHHFQPPPKGVNIPPTIITAKTYLFHAMHPVWCIY